MLYVKISAKIFYGRSDMQYYFAPMEGIAGYIFRNAFIHNYGGADKYFTPFLSGPKLGYKEINDILPENNAAKRLVPQILANKSETFLSIVSELKEYGYEEVNLNLGCPSGTVTSKKRGAGFLSVPDELERFLDEIYSKCDIKISVKTRIGMDELSEWERLMSIFGKFPIYELIIHPRLRRELYGGEPHRDMFARAQAYYSSSASAAENSATTLFPLVYNGDICSVCDLEALLSEYPFIKSVMIGRGALKNPEIFLLLKAWNTAENTTSEKLCAVTDCRNNSDSLDRFIRYHNEIYNAYKEIMYGEKPVLFKMKELWNWFQYYAGLDAKELKKIRKAGNLADYEAVIRSLLAVH